jgi:hypothetical protein
MGPFLILVPIFPVTLTMSLGKGRKVDAALGGVHSTFS